MHSGRLRHAIEIQTYTATKNSYGEQILTWSKFKSRYAQKIESTGDEVENSGKVQQTQTRTFKFRYADGLTPDMRIKYHDQYYGITAITSDPRDTKFQIAVCEKQSETVTP